jgi:hypothetical protein
MADRIFVQFELDTDAIHARHVALSRRQVAAADHYSDNHYATFYGTDFGNVNASPVDFAQKLTSGQSPFVWSGGVNFTHSVASVSLCTDWQLSSYLMRCNDAGGPFRHLCAAMDACGASLDGSSARPIGPHLCQGVHLL